MLDKSSGRRLDAIALVGLNFIYSGALGDVVFRSAKADALFCKTSLARAVFQVGVN